MLMYYLVSRLTCNLNHLKFKGFQRKCKLWQSTSFLNVNPICLVLHIFTLRKLNFTYDNNTLYIGISIINFWEWKYNLDIYNKIRWSWNWAYILGITLLTYNLWIRYTYRYMNLHKYWNFSYKVDIKDSRLTYRWNHRKFL